jgi:hypothetical protein
MSQNTCDGVQIHAYDLVGGEEPLAEIDYVLRRLLGRARKQELNKVRAE